LNTDELRLKKKNKYSRIKRQDSRTKNKRIETKEMENGKWKVQNVK